MTFLGKTIALTCTTTILALAGFIWPWAWIGSALCAVAIVALFVREGRR